MSLILLLEALGEAQQRHEACLSQAGYKVISVTSYAEAIPQVKRWLPDLILCSDHTPLEIQTFLQSLQAEAETSAIPRLVLSESADAELCRQWMLKGADDCFSAHTSCDVLLSTVAMRLRRYQQMRADLQLTLAAYESQDHQYRQLFMLLAHDLRNIFSGLVGAANLLRETSALGQDASNIELLDMFSHSAQSGAYVLEQTLAYLESTPEDLLLASEALNLKALLEQVLVLLNFKIQSKQIQVQLNICPNLGVYAEFRVLFSVLYNVLDNAVKFTPAGGQILCSLEVHEAKRCVVTIQDQGPGLSAEQCQQVLQGKKTKYSGQPEPDLKRGWGVGLWLSRHLLSQMGGSLDFNSEVGQGTSVTLQLPLTPTLATRH